MCYAAYMSTPSSSQMGYIPGVCNIGPAEIILRKRAGWVFAAATLLAAWALHHFHARPDTALVIFFPATISSVGFLQAYLHFCVKFGMQGLFNVSASELRTESVDQTEWRKKDKRKAQMIIVGSFLIGILLTIGVYLSLH